MVAGEFAVLEPYHKLVVIAVDRFVYTTIQSSDDNVLTLENFGLENIKWSWDEKQSQVNLAVSDGRTRFVEAAMNVTLTYLAEQSIVPEPFSCTIRSELDDTSGKKYGLGSSAAVVTSVVSAILEKGLGELPAEDLVFKLASIAHVVTQGNGSGADIAASTYGGMLEYSSFQADWLLTQYENKASLLELVEKDWIYCSIKQIQIPAHIHISVGWTGSPASTGKLVNKILRLKTTKQQDYEAFLTSSEEAVQLFLKGLTLADDELLFKGVRLNRKALSMIGERANVELETPLLTKLCDLANDYGGAGKLSGAGGGDCGIAFMLSQTKKDSLEKAWKEAHIQPLAISVYFK